MKPASALYDAAGEGRQVDSAMSEQGQRPDLSDEGGRYHPLDTRPMPHPHATCDSDEGIGPIEQTGIYAESHMSPSIE
jgi:hypothetical protein